MSPQWLSVSTVDPRPGRLPSAIAVLDNRLAMTIRRASGASQPRAGRLTWAPAAVPLDRRCDCQSRNGSADVIQLSTTHDVRAGHRLGQWLVQDVPPSGVACQDAPALSLTRLPSTRCCGPAQ